MINRKEWKTGLLFAAGLTGSVLFLCSIGLHYSSPGSWTGLLISLFVMFASLFPRQWKEWKESRRKKYPIFFKLLRDFLYILCALSILFSLLILSAVTPSLPKDQNVTVIICGSGVNHDGTVSLIGRTRIDGVLEWLKDHPDVPVIVSGGNYSALLPSEAQSMKNDLLEHGIEENRIYMEPGSINTKQNLAYSAKVIEEEHLPNHVLIATSEFHEFRSSLYAKRNGLMPYRMPGKTPWYLLPSCFIREWYGILIACTLDR